MSYKELVPHRKKATHFERKDYITPIDESYNQCHSDFQPLIEYVEKLEAEVKSIKKLCDNWDEFKQVFDSECQLPDLADRVQYIFAEVALNAEKAHCTDDPLECPALKRFADAEKTGKFTCACCGVELLPQGEWSLCFNCEKMNADRLHPEAEKAERCPEGEYYCKDCGWVKMKDGLCKHIGKLSTSGEDK